MLTPTLKSGGFDRPGQPEKFEDEDLEALLDEDRCQTLPQLSDTLNVTETAVKAARVRQTSW